MAETFPQLLLERQRELGAAVALREKHYGIWQSITWDQYVGEVKHLCLGLMKMGLTPDDTVAIIGDNRPEWIYAELAAQAAGSKSIGIYQDAVVAEMIYVIQEARVKFIVVEDQEQVDKILEMWGNLSGVDKVIYYDPKGLKHYDEPFLMPFEAVQELGRALDAEQPGRFEASVAAGKSDDVAILSTTSGTTGKPKLAMLSHKNLISQGRAMLATDPIEAGDDFVSFLPMAWVGEQMISFACSLQAGFVLNFPEEPETAIANVREIGPRTMFSPPRIWENLISTVQVKIEDTTPIKRRFYKWAMQVGHATADVRFRKEQPSPWQRLAYFVADWTVFQEIKDQLGLRHVQRAYTGGAALGPDVFRFFHALGVNLKQVYGQTETSGLSVIHRDGDIKFQTVGEPLPGTEIRIADSGEILVRADSVFSGYYNNRVATDEVLREGWFHSGDAGYFDDDGHLIVIDRAKDVMTLHDGTKFSPQFIENKLKFSPYIREAVVFGGDWPFVTAMINIDMDNAGKWAENHQLAYTTYTDLAQKESIYALVREQVERVNDDLPNAARIRRFLLLHKELDADDEEMTRTRKVRRSFVAQRYSDIIDALYGSDDHLDVKTVITYQDGRSATIATRLKIETPNGA